jgi:adenylylsulfate kinase
LFHEIYIHADIDVCEKRDPKGLYRKARAGLISDFTGVSAPYEVPHAPELTVDTGVLDVAQSVDLLERYVTCVFKS